MRRAILLVLSVVLLTACGGGGSSSHKPELIRTLTAPSGQRSYKVRLPNGKVVIQAHSPTLAQPPKGLQLPRPTSGVATVEQFDSVTTSTIPSNAHYVAGYVDGLYRTYRKLLGHFPVVIGISVRTSDGADCFDMEPGNPGPQNAARWAKFQFGQHNARPCEYSMLSWMPAIRANLASNGVRVCTTSTATHCVRLWDANWNFFRHLDSGYACTQWTDHSGGRNLDESTCATWFYKTRPRVIHFRCFGSHAALKRVACKQIRPKVASQSRAVVATRRALRRNNCRKPYRRKLCQTLGQRDNWFRNAIHKEVSRVYTANA